MRESELEALRQLVAANRAADLRKLDLNDAGAVAALRWDGADAAAGLPLLKAYQRVIRVLEPGEEARAFPLLEAGFDSALQIAATPRMEFRRRWAGLFPDEEALADAVHASARGIRAYLALRHVDAVQSNEPHYRSARFK